MIRLFNRQLNVELNGELTGKLNVKLNGEVPSNEGAFKVNWPPTIYSDNLRGNLRGVNHFQNVLTKTSLQKRFIQNIATRPFITTRLKRSSVYRSKKTATSQIESLCDYCQLRIANFEPQAECGYCSVDTATLLLSTAQSLRNCPEWWSSNYQIKKFNFSLCATANDEQLIRAAFNPWFSDLIFIIIFIIINLLTVVGSSWTLFSNVQGTLLGRLFYCQPAVPLNLLSSSNFISRLKSTLFYASQMTISPCSLCSLVEVDCNSSQSLPRKHRGIQWMFSIHLISTGSRSLN